MLSFLWSLPRVPTHVQCERQEGSISMAAQLLKRLLGRLCPHRFSWPHSGTNGQDYQVCLICGTIYAYDWSTMRRTGQLVVPPDGPAEFVQGKES